MVGKKQKEKKLAVGRAHYCSHPSRDDESWARALAAPLTKIPFKGGKSQPWDDVVGYEDLLDVCLSSIIRTVILRHFSLSLMRNSNGNDVMKANVTWCQYWFSPHKDIFVSQDLFFLTVVQALHHIFIFIPIVISLFYSKKYLHIYCYEASLLQSTFLVAQWWKKKNPPASTGDADSISASRRFPGDENGNPFQYYCLGNPWTEEPGRLQYTGSQRAGHDLTTKQQQQKQIQGCYQAFS